MATATITNPLTHNAPVEYADKSAVEEVLLEALEGRAVELTDEEWRTGDIMGIARERLAQRR